MGERGKLYEKKMREIRTIGKLGPTGLIRNKEVKSRKRSYVGREITFKG